MLVANKIIKLQERHAPEGLRLSIESGWNQTIDDWRTLLRLGRGFGVSCTGGQIVATGIALPYPPAFGWIGMVLVQKEYRRQGLATRLLMRTVEELRSKGLTPMLDATPVGRPVYERMGFTAIEGISRWRRGPQPQGAVDRLSVDPVAILSLDRQAFGADRSHLLKSICERPGSTLLIDPDKNGYAIARQGRTALQVGPVVTLDSERQGTIAIAAAALTAGAVILDIPDNAEAATAAAAKAGFLLERPLTRMALGRVIAFGTPALVAAIAGPEFG